MPNRPRSSCSRGTMKIDEEEQRREDAARRPTATAGRDGRFIRGRWWRPRPRCSTDATAGGATVDRCGNRGGRSRDRGRPGTGRAVGLDHLDDELGDASECSRDACTRRRPRSLHRGRSRLARSVSAGGEADGFDVHPRVAGTGAGQRRRSCPRPSRPTAARAPCARHSPEVLGRVENDVVQPVSPPVRDRLDLQIGSITGRWWAASARPRRRRTSRHRFAPPSGIK